MTYNLKLVYSEELRENSWSLEQGDFNKHFQKEDNYLILVITDALVMLLIKLI
tara:strand:- start:3720 stop:3878 length:159 start_codon:yes stop_codon:yes gene_type:complete